MAARVRRAEGQARAFAKELSRFDPKVVKSKGVPRGVDRFDDAERWPVDDLASEIDNVVRAMRGWLKGVSGDLLVWHDGQQ